MSETNNDPSYKFHGQIELMFGSKQSGFHGNEIIKNFNSYILDFRKSFLSLFGAAPAIKIP